MIGTVDEVVKHFRSSPTVTTNTLVKRHKASQTTIHRILTQNGIQKGEITRRALQYSFNQTARAELKRCSTCKHIIFDTIEQMCKYDFLQIYHFEIYANFGGLCRYCHNEKVIYDVPRSRQILSSILQLSESGKLQLPDSHIKKPVGL